MSLPVNFTASECHCQSVTASECHYQSVTASEIPLYPNPKPCSSWKRILGASGKLTDITEQARRPHQDIFHRRVGLKWLKEYPLEEIKYKLKHYFKFLFVRDPYARLLSAYRDKIVKLLSNIQLPLKPLKRDIAQSEITCQELSLLTQPVT